MFTWIKKLFIYESKSGTFSFIEQFLILLGAKPTASKARISSIAYGIVMGGFMPILAFVASHIWYATGNQWIAGGITVAALGYSLPKVSKLCTSALGAFGGVCMALSIEAGMVLSTMFEGWQAVTLGYVCLTLLVVANSISASNELYFNCKTLVTTKGKAKKGK